MRNRSIGRLVGIGLVAGGLTMGALAVPGLSGAVQSRAGSTLTVAFPPNGGSGPGGPSSVFPFYSAAACTTLNIDYWDLAVRPGYWFGLGSSVAEQPALSPLNPPTVTKTGANTTVSFTLKGWKWYNGTSTETMTAQDVAFWMNLDRAQKGQGVNAACGYAPGFGIPDGLTSVTYPHGLAGDEVSMVFKGHPSSLWILYNELSQIVPLNTHWDTTNGTNNAGCSTMPWGSVSSPTGTTGLNACNNVFNYLSGLQINNSLWNWADGPYMQQSAEYSGGVPDGNDVQVANPQYSGPVKAHAVQTIQYKPYATTDAEISDLQSNKLDFGYADPADVSKAPGPGLAGHNLLPNMGSYKTVGTLTFGVFYWMLNFDNSGSSFRTKGSPPSWARLNTNLYFRAALSESTNQNAVIQHVDNGYEVDTYSAIPTYPKNSFNAGVKDPYPYSPSKGKALMKANGWNVSKFPAVCAKSNCAAAGGEAIPKGTKASETVIVPAGDTAVKQATLDEINQIKAASDIQIIAQFRPLGYTQDACFGGKHTWELCGYGGWIYAPDFYPSGEVLFAKGSGSNSGGYASKEMNGLIAETTTAGDLPLNAKSPKYHTSFGEFTATDVPFLWQPTPTGFIEQNKSVAGAQAPNPLTDFNPEYITSI